MGEAGAVALRDGGARLLDLANFVKLEHTLFSLPILFAGALVAAGRWPSLGLSLLIIAAGTGARTAALALNRIIDSSIDARNPRTRARELPAGRLTIRQAWAVCVGGMILYLAAAAMLGVIPLLLSPVPLVVFTGYPFMKRFTPLAHFGVGLGLALAPLGAWVAVTQRVVPDAPVGLLAIFTLLWVAGFDIIYAVLDIEFDREATLHSIPSRFGRPAALLIAAMLHAAAIGCLLLLSVGYFSGPLRFYALAPVVALFVLQHVLSRNINFAFFHVNSVLGFFVLLFVWAGVA